MPRAADDADSKSEWLTPSGIPEIGLHLRNHVIRLNSKILSHKVFLQGTMEKAIDPFAFLDEKSGGITSSLQHRTDLFPIFEHSIERVLDTTTDDKPYCRLSLDVKSHLP